MIVFPAKETGAAVDVVGDFGVGVSAVVACDVGEGVGLEVGGGVVPGVQANRSARTTQSADNSHIFLFFIATPPQKT